MADDIFYGDEPDFDYYDHIQKTIPGINITSGYRTPEYQADMRRRGYKPAKGSKHLTGGALDLTPPSGKSYGWLTTQLRRIYPEAKLLNEGDHIHAIFPGYTKAPALGGAAAAGIVNPNDVHYGDDAPDEVAPVQQTPQAPKAVSNDPLAAATTGYTQDDLARQLAAEQTPEYLAQRQNDVVSGSNLGPENVPGGSWAERVSTALATGVLPQEYAGMPFASQIDALGRILAAGNEAIRGTPLEGLALAFPLGGAELGGPAALGRLTAADKAVLQGLVKEGRPLDEVNQFLQEKGAGQMDPASYQANQEFFRKSPEAAPGEVVEAVNDNVRIAPEEAAMARDLGFREAANENPNELGFDGGIVQQPENFQPKTAVPGDEYNALRPANENVNQVDYDAIANEAQKAGDPNADLYWQSKVIADSGNHHTFSMDALENVMDGLDAQIKAEPNNPLLQGIMDNLEEVWTQKRAAMAAEETPKGPVAANEETKLSPQQLTDDPLEQEAIRQGDIWYDIAFNDERRSKDRRTKDFKDYEAEVKRAEIRYKEAARKYYDTFSDEDLDRIVRTDNGLSGEAAREVQTLRTIPNEPLFLEDSKKGGGEPPETPGNKLYDLIRKAENNVKRQEQDRAAERKVRVAQMMEARKGTEGREGFHQELSALKGAMPKRTLDDALDNLSQDDLNGLFTQIRDSELRPFESIRARSGLQKVLEGELPQQSEINLLKKVFGPDLVDKLVEHTPTADPGRIAGQREMFPQGETLSTGPMRTLGPEAKVVDPEKFVDDPLQGDFFKEKPRFNKGGPKGPTTPSGPKKHTYNAFTDALNLPFALMSSYDLSGMFRQGAFLISRPEFWKATPDMAKALFSDKNYHALMSSIEARPSFPDMRKAGLAFTEMTDDLLKREENFASSIADKIPGIKASGRAYAGFLNKLRADVFDRIMSDYQKAGVDILNDQEGLRNVGKYINAATGRGDLPKSLQSSAPLLNALLFSPRLMASRVRLLDPTYLVRTASRDPVLAKNMLRDYVGFGGLVSTVLAVAKMSGADIETDPRSSDFAKIKDGNTRHDLLAGFQQYIRLASQLATGETKTLKGDIKELGEGYKPETRLSKVITFFRSKGSPIATFVADYLDGKNVIGEPFEVQKAVAERLTPLTLGGLYDAYEEQGFEGVLKSLDSLFGVGVQTFDANRPRGETTQPEEESLQYGDAENPEGLQYGD